jgi:hypothetical protein
MSAWDLGVRHVAHSTEVVIRAKMHNKIKYPLILVASVSFVDAATSLSCPPITTNDLGSTTEFVPPGEVVSSIPVRIRNFTKVCDAAGGRMNTSSFISVVVEFQCNFEGNMIMNNISLAVCSNPSTIVTMQAVPVSVY